MKSNEAALPLVLRSSLSDSQIKLNININQTTERGGMSVSYLKAGGHTAHEYIVHCLHKRDYFPAVCVSFVHIPKDGPHAYLEDELQSSPLIHGR